MQIDPKSPRRILRTSGISAMCFLMFLVSIDSTPLAASEPAVNTPRKLLTKDDFHYLGRVHVDGMGWATSGLAYRPETETWFTIEKSGKSPYGLYEFKMPEPVLPPEPAPPVEIVQSWGPLNQDKRLDVKG